MKLEAVNVVVTGDKEIKHLIEERLNECLAQIPVDSETVHLIKIDVGDCPAEIAQRAAEHIRDLIKHYKDLHCVFVPVGGRLPIHDIQIELIRVVNDGDVR